MILGTRKLSINKNGSISEKFVLGDDFDATGFRVAGYVKLRPSDQRPATTLDCKLSSDNKSVDVSLHPTKSRSLPVGQVIYVIELTKGAEQYNFSNYLDINP